MKTVFYRCRHCGNVILKTHDSGVPVQCCGEDMEELQPQSKDDGQEKHLPVTDKPDDYSLHVTIGSVEHPMMQNHYILFVYLETEKGGQIAYLSPSDKPSVTFCCKHDKPVAVYEYCNLHGLWKTPIQ